MARSLEMFDKPPRLKPRVMMHATDHGHEGKLIARMKCQKCGHDDGWHECENDTDMRRGAPCPVCNATAPASEQTEGRG